MNQRRLRNLKKQVCCGGIKRHCLGLFSELKMTFWIVGRGGGLKKNACVDGGYI
jgi:hypothetical protein